MLARAKPSRFSFPFSRLHDISAFMKYRSLLSMAFLLLSSLVTHAGGSVHRDSLEKLFKTNPTLGKLLQKNFVLGETGEALRLGRHMGALGGTRIGPYEFPASAQPDGSKVIVVLHTEVTVKDAKGRVLELDQLTPQSTGLSMSEILLSYEVKTAQKKQSIGEIVRSLDEGSLKWVASEFQGEDGPESGRIRKGYFNDELRRVILDYSMGDHDGVSVDVFADAAKKPVFVLVTESSWKFVAPKKTEDLERERRLYFENEKLIKVLEKSYRFRDEAQKVAKRDAAVNKKLEVSALMGSKWYGRSQGLLYESTIEKLMKAA